MATGTPMAGKDGIVKVGTTAVGYIDTWSLTLNRGTAEVSQIGRDYKDFIGTVKDFSGSMSGTMAYGDTEQKAMVDQFLTGGSPSELTAAFKCNDNLTINGNIIVTSVAIGASHGDKVTFSCNFQGTGDLKAEATA